MRTLDRLVSQIMNPLSIHQLALSRRETLSRRENQACTVTFLLFLNTDCLIQPAQPKTNLLSSNNTSPPPPRIASKSQSRSQTVNKTARSPLHSILKKPRTAQSEPQKTTRLLLKKPDGESITRIPSNPPTPNMSDLNTKDTKENQAGHQTNKKTSFSVSRASRNTKRQPVFNHRKSQTSILKESSPSQQSRSPENLFESFDALFDDDSFLKSSHNSLTDVISENEPGTSWLDVESMQMSLPVPKKQSATLVTTSQDSGLAISNKTDRKEKQNITPAVHAMSDKQDPVLPQGIETVSAEPEPMSQTQTSEGSPLIRSSSEQPQDDATTTEPTDIPHFPGAKSIPMPEDMLNQLVDIVNNPEPLDEWIPLPERPWFLAEHAWLPLVPRQYLFDWMIRDHTFNPNPQPSRKELVEDNFRAKFQIDLERARAAAKREANVDVPFAIPEEDEDVS